MENKSENLHQTATAASPEDSLLHLQRKRGEKAQKRKMFLNFLQFMNNFNFFLLLCNDQRNEADIDVFVFLNII